MSPPTTLAATSRGQNPTEDKVHGIINEIDQDGSGKVLGAENLIVLPVLCFFLLQYSIVLLKHFLYYMSLSDIGNNLLN